MFVYIILSNTPKIGLMGTALRRHPQSLRVLEHPELIQDILEYAINLRFLLQDKYDISLSQVIAIRVGSDVVEFRTALTTLTFNLGEDEEVFMPSADNFEEREVTLDPVLRRNLMAIIEDYAS